MSTGTLEVVKEKIDLEEIKKKKINLALFGHGNVGRQLIDQIITSKADISSRRDVELSIFAVTDSNTVLLKKDGVNEQWEQEKLAQGLESPVSQVVNFTKEHGLTNLIAVDNTASN